MNRYEMTHDDLYDYLDILERENSDMDVMLRSVEANNKLYKKFISVFEEWLNVKGNNQPDPENVREIQRFWVILKKEYC